MKTFDAIYAVVASIPRGKVLTYKDVAVKARIGNPRVVGFALHVNDDPGRIPCHRVVRSDGTLASGYAFGGKHAQRKRLVEEGVPFVKKYRVNFTQALSLEQSRRVEGLTQ